MTNNPRQYQVEAIVIKKTRLGEAGRILTLYTAKRGKLQGIAKGISKTKSKLSGHLELLSYSQISLVRGKNLDTITGSQTIESFLPLKSSLEPLSYGIYFSELLNHFCREGDACHPLFVLSINTFKELCQPDCNYELVRYYYEMKLFNETGYRPCLRECVTCRQLIKATTNHFIASAGGILCASCAARRYINYPISVNALKVLRVLQEEDYTTARRLKLSPSLYQEVSRLTGHYISYILERDVKSLSWLEEIRKHTVTRQSALL
jgi:DNA repair protein RecO (recombination protein O)